MHARSSTSGAHDHFVCAVGTRSGGEQSSSFMCAVGECAETVPLGSATGAADAAAGAVPAPPVPAAECAAMGGSTGGETRGMAAAGGDVIAAPEAEPGAGAADAATDDEDCAG